MSELSSAIGGIQTNRNGLRFPSALGAFPVQHSDQNKMGPVESAVLCSGALRSDTIEVYRGGESRVNLGE
jgi:hypothetical protein